MTRILRDALTLCVLAVLPSVLVAGEPVCVGGKCQLARPTAAKPLASPVPATNCGLYTCPANGGRGCSCVSCACLPAFPPRAMPGPAARLPAPARAVRGPVRRFVAGLFRR